MATYQEQADLYADMESRPRMIACVKEQGYIFTADGRPDIAALGRGVVSGSMVDVDAVVSALCSYSGAGDLTNDDELLSAVQAVWPTVAAARYPDEA